MIPKKHYHVDLEQNTVIQLFFDYDLKKILNKCGVSQRYQTMLSKLQEVHDEHDVKYWRRELKIVASSFKVSTAKMDKEGLISQPEYHVP